MTATKQSGNFSLWAETMFLTKLVKVSHLRAANLLSYHKATKRTTIRAFSASPGNGNDGVSLVQGASRGLGLEFVRFNLTISLFMPKYRQSF